MKIQAITWSNITWSNITWSNITWSNITWSNVMPVPQNKLERQSVDKAAAKADLARMLEVSGKSTMSIAA